MSDILSYNQALKNTNILTDKKLENRLIKGFFGLNGDTLFRIKWDYSFTTGTYTDITSVANSTDILLGIIEEDDILITYNGSDKKIYNTIGKLGIKPVNIIKAATTTTYTVNDCSFFDINKKEIYFQDSATPKAMHISLQNIKTSVYGNSGNSFGICDGFVYVTNAYNNRVYNFDTGTYSTSPITLNNQDKIVGWFDKLFLIDGSTGDFYSFDTNTNTWSSKLGTITGYPTNLTNSASSSIYQSVDGYGYFASTGHIYRWKINSNTIESIAIPNSRLGVLPSYA